jgi:hypothetical protein
MPSKRPPTKHTKKAIDAKHRANKLQNGGAGGGKSAIAARLERSRYVCVHVRMCAVGNVCVCEVGSVCVCVVGSVCVVSSVCVRVRVRVRVSE